MPTPVTAFERITEGAATVTAFADKTILITQVLLKVDRHVVRDVLSVDGYLMQFMSDGKLDLARWREGHGLMLSGIEDEGTSSSKVRSIVPRLSRRRSASVGSPRPMPS